MFINADDIHIKSCKNDNLLTLLLFFEKLRARDRTRDFLGAGSLHKCLQ